MDIGLKVTNRRKVTGIITVFFGIVFCITFSFIVIFPEYRINPFVLFVFFLTMMINAFLIGSYMQLDKIYKLLYEERKDKFIGNNG